MRVCSVLRRLRGSEVQGSVNEELFRRDHHWGPGSRGLGAWRSSCALPRSSSDRGLLHSARCPVGRFVWGKPGTSFFLCDQRRRRRRSTPHFYTHSPADRCKASFCSIMTAASGGIFCLLRTHPCLASSVSVLFKTEEVCC